VKPAEAFLRAIIEDPDDDARRLVYADWLEENGDTARAEFIRVGCELARVPFQDPRWLGLRRREGELLAAHRVTWLGELSAAARECNLLFRRGFPEEANCTVNQFLQGARGLFRSAPVTKAWLRHFGGPDVWEELSSRPELARLRVLELSSCNMGVRDVRTLAASQHLANLVKLRLHPRQMGDGLVNVLVGTSAFSNLKILDLRAGRARFTEAGRRRLRGHFGERVLLPP
jgi:uncharacterized protein (TIGR02996 family)